MVPVVANRPGQQLVKLWVQPTSMSPFCEAVGRTKIRMELEEHPLLALNSRGRRTAPSSAPVMEVTVFASQVEQRKSSPGSPWRREYASCKYHSSRERTEETAFAP